MSTFQATLFIIASVIAGILYVEWAKYLISAYKRFEDRVKSRPRIIRENLPFLLYTLAMIITFITAYWIPLEYLPKKKYSGFFLFQIYVLGQFVGMILRIIISRINAQKAKKSYQHDSHPVLTKKGERLAGKHARNLIFTTILGMLEKKLNKNA